MSEYAFHYFVNYGTVIFLFWLCLEANICDSFCFFSAQFVGHCKFVHIQKFFYVLL